MKRYLLPIALVVLILGAVAYFITKPSPDRPLRVAISPYQDIATIVNIGPLKLEDKYKTKVELLTMAWEDIIPALGSAGRTVDVGFGSFIEYLTKERQLNSTGSDPLLFVFPAYIFKGGSFITFKADVPILSRESLKSTEAIRAFLSLRIGAQKGSVYEMMVYSLARRGDFNDKSLRLFDTPLNDGLLATESGSLDIASAGLTQLTEATKRGGRVALTMEDLGFADITGFICRRSTLDSRRAEIEAFIKMWYECVGYLFADLDTRSAVTLEYLRTHSSTHYTLDQYKSALSQEYFPRSLQDAEESIVADSGQYSYHRIAEDLNHYFTTVRGQQPARISDFISIAAK